jgi:hypothetical protein
MQYLNEDTMDQGGGSPMPETGGGDQIPLSRAEYEKLVRQAARSEDLESRLKQGEQDWNHVRNVLRPGGDPSEVEQSVRQLMAREGYSAQEIEQYVQEMNDDDASVQEEGGDEYDPEEEAAKQFVKKTTGEIENLKEITRRNEKNRLESTLDETVDMAIDDDTPLGTLFNIISSTYEDDDNNEQASLLLETMMGDVKRETLERLRIRRIREGGRWSDGWIQEEAAQAAKAVHGKYRLLVPNPSKLGRSSDYSAEQDYVTNTQPVKAPEYKRGMNPADVSREARGWAVDQLLRASADAERGSKSDSPI